MSEEKFWILWNPGSPRPPTKKFSSAQEAEEVADIMALKSPNSEFIVMESTIGKLRSKKLEKKTYSRKPRKPKKVEVVSTRTLRDRMLTYDEWRKQGRQVMRGQRPSEISVFGNPIFTYDQTEDAGHPHPRLPDQEL